MFIMVPQHICGVSPFPKNVTAVYLFFAFLNPGHTKTYRNRTLRPLDMQVCLFSAQFPLHPAHVKIDISTRQNFQCLLVAAILV